MAGQRRAEKPARSGSHRAPAKAAPRRRGRPRRRNLATLASATVATAAVVLGGGGLALVGEETDDAEGRRSATALDLTPRTDRQSASRAADDLRLEADTAVAASSDSTRLPAGSGSGRRVVYSESRQRVWLVDADGRADRTYLVSGSVYDNLEPGRYEVFSRSRDAVGIDDSGTMEYFVRFTYGDAGAAIGFHTIPVDDGRPVQTAAELGTPRSHGCVRQRRSDAIALWEFAPLGTRVVVTP